MGCGRSKINSILLEELLWANGRIDLGSGFGGSTWETWVLSTRIIWSFEGRGAVHSFHLFSGVKIVKEGRKGDFSRWVGFSQITYSTLLNSLQTFFQRLAGASLLIFANKQDLPGALSFEQIKKVVERKRKWGFLSSWSPSPRLNLGGELLIGYSFSFINQSWHLSSFYNLTLSLVIIGKLWDAALCLALIWNKAWIGLSKISPLESFYSSNVVDDLFKVIVSFLPFNLDTLQW